MSLFRWNVHHWRHWKIQTLQWLHNGRNGVSDHQPHDCLLNRFSGADQRKHQSSASLAFVQEIHRGPVNSPHKGPVTRKMFPFDDVIMEVVNLKLFWLWQWQRNRNNQKIAIMNSKPSSCITVGDSDTNTQMDWVHLCKIDQRAMETMIWVQIRELVMFRYIV